MNYFLRMQESADLKHGVKGDPSKQKPVSKPKSPKKKKKLWWNVSKANLLDDTCKSFKKRVFFIVDALENLEKCMAILPDNNL